MIANKAERARDMSSVPVITEEIKRMIGRELGKPIVREVTKEAIQRVAWAIDDPSPLWQDEEYAKGTRYGGIVAPPVFLVCLWPEGTEFPEIVDNLVKLESPLTRVLAAGNEFEYFEPVRPGDVITITSKLADAREHEGKLGKMLLLDGEVTYTNQEGKVVVKQRVGIIRY